jgi:hypothetical protein
MREKGRDGRRTRVIVQGQSVMVRVMASVHV